MSKNHTIHNTEYAKRRFYFSSLEIANTAFYIFIKLASIIKLSFQDLGTPAL